jgi:hypothetical protein
MGYLTAGLLSGFGQGLQLMGQQQHEAAMEALRNQRQIEQETRAEDRDNRKSVRENSEKVGLLELAQKYKMAEGETEFQYKARLERLKAGLESAQIDQKGKVDANLAVLKADLDKRNDAESQRLKATLDAERAAGRSVETRVDANGRMILKFEDGRMVATNFTERDNKETLDPRAKDIKHGPTPKSFDPNSVDTSSNPTQNPTWYTVGTVVAKPKVGEVRDGYIFKGGDPASPSSWVKK